MKKTFLILTKNPVLPLAMFLIESGLSPCFPVAIGACKVLHFINSIVLGIAFSKKKHNKICNLQFDYMS